MAQRFTEFLRARPRFQALNNAIVQEADRWLLWFPVGLGFGVALYFLLPFEPPLIPGLVAVGLGLVGMALGRRFWEKSRWFGFLAIFSMVFTLLATGLSLAKGHSLWGSAPVLAKRIGPVFVVGRVMALEPGLKGARMTLDQLVIDRLSQAATPKRVRLRLRRKWNLNLAQGDRVRIRAMMSPPPGPAAPGAFDFARLAWFRGLGGVGFAVSKPTRITIAASEAEGIFGKAAKGFGHFIAGLRRHLFEKITKVLPGASGGIAAALMTGERGNIPPPAMEYMRAAGLAHLLAISGLHIGLVTGILFFSLRALLVLIPGAALNHPIKKWAAGAALLGAGAYLLLTGATVPTQRAFLMTGLVLTAVMVDRAAISMRLVAWAAVVVLAVAPDSLMGPSFQMSFAAVVALIAVYESARHPLVILRGNGGISRRIMIYGAGVLLTTLVAGMATAPFALYHFNRFASFGLIANLGAVPVTAFWIMPWAVMAYILTPFGLEHLALVPMGWGVDGVRAIARFVSTRPGASIWVSAMPPWGIALVAIGGLWLCLWRGRWRFAGPVVILVGMLSLAVYQPPDVLVAGNGKSFAVYDSSGELLFGGEKGSKFQREIWLRRSGNGERLALAQTRPKKKRGKNKRHTNQRADTVRALKCDALGCVFQVRGREISLIYSPAAASEDCPRSDVVVSLQPLGRTKCRGPVRVIDRFDLWREGAHAIWIDEAGMVRVETVASMRGARPWVQKPKRRTRKAPKK